MKPLFGGFAASGTHGFDPGADVSSFCSWSDSAESSSRIPIRIVFLTSDFEHCMRKALFRTIVV